MARRRSRAVSTRVRTVVVKRGRASRYRSWQKSLPSLPILMLAGLAPVTISTFNEGRYKGPQAAGTHLLKVMTGFDMVTNEFRFRELKLGLAPVLLGTLAHKFIGGKLGINRALGAAGIPLIRL